MYMDVHALLRVSVSISRTSFEMQIPRTAPYLLCFLSFTVASLNSELKTHAPNSQLQPISPAHTQHKPLQARGGIFSEGHTPSEYYPVCETAFAHDYCDHHCTCASKELQCRVYPGNLPNPSRSPSTPSSLGKDLLCLVRRHASINSGSLHCKLKHAILASRPIASPLKDQRNRPVATVSWLNPTSASLGWQRPMAGEVRTGEKSGFSVGPST